MTSFEDRHDYTIDDLLDFPGARELVAAGQVQAPSEETVRAARMALAQAALADRADLKDLTALGGVDRQDGVRGLGGRQGGEAAHGRRRALHLPRGRRLLVAAAAVAAIAAGAVVYPVVGMGDSKPAASATAAEFLDGMAEVAAAETAPESAPFWKIRTEVINEDDGHASTTEWFDRKGNIWSIDINGSPHRPAPVDKRKVWPMGDKKLNWPQVESLPADPDALAARMGMHAFEQSANLLNSPAHPKVRGALFQVMADQKGVKLVGTVKDSQGRTGTAVEYTVKQRLAAVAGESEHPDRSVTYRLVIDPKTGTLLEEQWRAKGDPTERSTYLEVGPADKVDW
ncbi:hypothetical protein [Streptomyces sp. NBC_01304]|uniref:hypothetical protein n=1 Tax=Streptomyces sp. NBC_01304 TaxID=2903818 RepID=UPI002E16439B|nr:hypothetical protein OG430_45430 [Streptomyces sp. NBC_01304]